MAIETIRFFSAANLTNSAGGQAIQFNDINGNLAGSGPFFVGVGPDPSLYDGTLVEIDDTGTITPSNNSQSNFDDGTSANQELNEAVTLTYDDGSGVVTNTFPAGTQIQAEFTVTFSSGFSIVGLRLENPDAPPNLITAGYTFFDAGGNPTVPPPGTNLGTVVSSTGNGTTPYANIVCFTPGCLIGTPDGDRPVEDLAVGDLVLTADHGPQPIRWVGRRHLDRLALNANPNLRPIRISAGALADQVPRRDLIVSPQHRVLLRSRIAIRMFDTAEILVAAKHLLGLPGVAVADDISSVTYIHVMCDDHEIVSAEGALTETLYTGVEAMKAMSDDAWQEITAIFGDRPYLDRPLARLAPKAKQVRHLVDRHMKNEKVLYSVS